MFKSLESWPGGEAAGTGVSLMWGGRRAFILRTCLQIDLLAEKSANIGGRGVPTGVRDGHLCGRNKGDVAARFAPLLRLPRDCNGWLFEASVSYFGVRNSGAARQFGVPASPLPTPTRTAYHRAYLLCVALQATGSAPIGQTLLSWFGGHLRQSTPSPGMDIQRSSCGETWFAAQSHKPSNPVLCVQSTPGPRVSSGQVSRRAGAGGMN